MDEEMMDAGQCDKQTAFEKVNIGSEKYTQVFRADEKAFDAHHRYVVRERSKEGEAPALVDLGIVKFQKGPIKENGVNGVMNEDLIAMVLDRLYSFQESQFKCRENAIAITKLEETLMWLRKRTIEREDRGVEGTHKV